MRAPQPFAYVIEELPRQLPIFDFLQKHGPVDDYEAYSNFNMGAGFALYVLQEDVDRVWRVLREGGYPDRCACNAGYIVSSSKKLVEINPKKLTYKADTLGIR